MNHHYLYTPIKICALLLILAGTTASCSRVYYTAPDTGAVASVSFSNLSPELPDIYIIDECGPLPVDHRLIEQKNPQQKSRYKTHIPAGKTITFKYEYNFLMRKGTQPVTYETELSSRIKIEKINSVSTCSRLVSFKPEKNMHYEVYFGLLDTHCSIKASKSVASDVSKKNILYNIPTTLDNPEIISERLKVCF